MEKLSKVCLQSMLYLQSMDDSVLHRHTFIHQMAFHEFYTDIHTEALTVGTFLLTPV